MMNINTDALKNTLRILGGVIKNTIDIGDYRITVIIERKIDEKNGIIVDNMVVEKRLNGVEIENITQRLKDVMNRI